MVRRRSSQRWGILLGTGFLLAAVFTMVEGGAAPALAAEFRLKGVSNSRPQVQFKMWEWMETELPKRTNGRVNLEVTSLPELGLTGFELVRVMKAGLVDMADVLPTYVSGDVPLIEGVDLPGFFSLEEFDKSHKDVIELVVGGKPIATGEAITIRDKFGMMITRIGSVQETLNKLRGELESS